MCSVVEVEEKGIPKTRRGMMPAAAEDGEKEEENKRQRRSTTRPAGLTYEWGR